MGRLFLLVGILIAMQWQSYGQEQKLVRSIYFGGGSFTIDPVQREKLVQFLDSIPDLSHYTITIHSHTDNIGGAAFNKRLSEARSLSARQLLIHHSILPEAIEIKDFGQHNPLYDNSTHEGRIRNRRVDIIFWPLSL